jgi:DNA-binding CsgD family transcriptional regulator
MFEIDAALAPVRHLSDTSHAGHVGARADAWRHASATAIQARVAHQMFDEIDYGMILLSDDLHVVQLNKTAWRVLNLQHPLKLIGNELHANSSADSIKLHEALANAAEKGLRKLLLLGQNPDRTSLSVVPLGPLDDDNRHAVLLLLSKRHVCEDQSVDWFARAHRLTTTETRVLKGLCAGLRPAEVATLQSVALSTVRSQIGSIRTKTGANGIRELVRQVAILPPLVNALHAFEHPAQGTSARHWPN